MFAHITPVSRIRREPRRLTSSTRPPTAAHRARVQALDHLPVDGHVSTRDLARRLRKRLNKSTEETQAAVAKVKNNAETAIKELEAKRT